MPKKVDHNHKSIVAGLRKSGAAVQSIAAIGKGAPDLLVAFGGTWYVAEIKDGSKPPSRQRLTTAEEFWHEEFSQRAPVHTWTSLDDALKAIGAASP